MSGFTGVVWDARSAARLAADLDTGPGAAAFAEPIVAWERFASDVEGAAIDYTMVVARLGEVWQSSAASGALRHLSDLGAWLMARAEQAGGVGVALQAQSATVAVARLAMPDRSQVDAVEALAAAACAATAIAPIASLVVGAAAHAERAVHAQRGLAVRVMQMYEAASETYASTPALPSPPPPLPASVVRHHTTRPATIHPAPQPESGMASAGSPASASGVAHRRQLGRYTPTLLAASSIAAASAPGAAASATASSPTSPEPPVAPITPGMVPGTTSERTVTRSGEDSPLLASLSVQSRDAVLPVTWEDVAGYDGPLGRIDDTVRHRDGHGGPS